MLIFFGWRTRASVVGNGVFHCPQCGADRSYALKRMRRWFTLFFLPVIPLKTVGDFVQCETCNQSFNTTVLETPTTATLQDELMWAIREATTVLLRAARSPASESAAISVLSAFAGRPWSDAELAQDLSALDTVHLQARLAHLAGTLNEQGKERFVAACAHVLATGGIINSDGRAAVEQMAVGLLMTPAHARGIVDQTLEDAEADRGSR
ncbi:MAG: zinc ribbon domain-containing protein [Acidimicrobiales bacterium]